MSRNTLIIGGVAVLVLIILIAIFSGGDDEAPAPEAATEAPASQ